MRRREDLDVVLFDQLSQKLPEVRHDRIMQAIVDLIDQQDPFLDAANSTVMEKRRTRPSPQTASGAGASRPTSR